MSSRLGREDGKRAAAVVGALVVLFGAVLSGVAVGGVAAASGPVYATAGGSDSAEYAPGDTFTVTVGSNATDVSAYQTNLTFDPAVVELQSVSGTGDFDDPVWNDGNGWVSFNQYRSSDTDEPVFATLTFEVVGDAGDGTTLSFVRSETKVANSAGQEESVTDYEGLTLSVESETPTPTETATDTPTPTETATDTPTDAPDENVPDPDVDSGSGESGDDGDGGGSGDAGDSGDSGDSGGDGGDSGGSANSGGGGGGGAELSGPPRLATYSSMVLRETALTMTFGGSSPTFKRLELRFDSEEFGKYSTVEYERLPSGLASKRDVSSDVTAFNVEPPSDEDSATGRVMLVVKREAIEDRNLSAEALRVERYDDAAGEWRVLRTEVVDSDDETVTLRTESSEFGWFVVTGTDSAQTESPTETQTSTATTTAEPTASPTSAATTAEPTDASETGTTDPSTGTETGTPGFGLITAIVAGATVLGYLRFRR